MSNREQRAEAYTDQGELNPLSWGRARIARKAVSLVDEIDDDDAASLAAMVYLLEFQELRKIPADKLLDRANEFAEELPVSTVIECGQAFGRDLGALEASEVQVPSMGKQKAPEEGHNHSTKPHSLQPASA